MSVLTMFYLLGINVNDEKSLNEILNQILNTTYVNVLTMSFFISLHLMKF